MTQKQVYEVPEMEIITFENEDIITTSGNNETDLNPYASSLNF